MLKQPCSNIFPVLREVCCRDIRVMISRSLFGQSQSSCYDIIQFHICIRRPELNRFRGAICCTRIAALAVVVPDRPFFRKHNIAWTYRAADFAPNAGVRHIKALVVFMLILEKRDHPARIQQPGNRRNDRDFFSFSIAISRPIKRNCGVLCPAAALPACIQCGRDAQHAGEVGGKWYGNPILRVGRDAESGLCVQRHLMCAPVLFHPQSHSY